MNFPDRWEPQGSGEVSDYVPIQSRKVVHPESIYPEFNNSSLACWNKLEWVLQMGNALDGLREIHGLLSPYKFTRRSVGSDDVSISILYCGVCFADVMWTRNRLGHSNYPLVPGHEIVGIVTEVGTNVQRFKVGDHVGVGTYVNSCRASPLLCAGITVYSPMMRHNMNQPGKSLGVIGLGGLGHLAVKFGKAFGLKVTVLSTSISKREEALNLLGADNFCISSDEKQMKALEKSFDFIINTASGDISFDLYLSLLKTAGVFVLVGFPSEVKFSPGSLALGAKTITGSVTVERSKHKKCWIFVLHKIYPEIELIPIQYSNEALERLIKRDVKYRFVIDIGVPKFLLFVRALNSLTHCYSLLFLHNEEKDEKDRPLLTFGPEFYGIDTLDPKTLFFFLWR
ncbi:putative cinnamyl alcohol dehydrogenase 1 [Sesamum angolense]|uniref:Cinnamyl alcohol dehydrogenase 1 n=1 Tax=Sesamum angolense TaxID=2727404 RepID=A0AAE2BWQ6_9LAMI|nr:putative cinnamyl alcohol dehydrogenase 1 [Sesamum angolense]